MEVHDAEVVSNDNLVERIEIEDLATSPLPKDQSPKNILEVSSSGIPVNMIHTLVGYKLPFG